MPFTIIVNLIILFSSLAVFADVKDDQLIEVAEESTAWWSLRPLKFSSPPKRMDSQHPIDAFVRDKLEEKGLHPAPQAQRRVLIRRLYYDLTGLPPSPMEVESFITDTDPAACENLVDRLLASPRYGERWARHWMDTAHFAETHGHDQDRIRENAWPYRDYLIAAFNQDKPYSQFVREQVAADVLIPNDPQAIAALGFLAAGPWDESSLRDIREDTLDRQIGRNIDRDDMLTNVMSNFTSLTVQCARCHDHKFDPIPQADYYALQAVFAGVERANRSYDTGAKPSLVYAAAADFEPDGGLKPPLGPRPIHRLERGDIRNPKEEAFAGSLTCIAQLPSRFSQSNAMPESARRAALAEWIVHKDNPLTWRSIANRVWLQHFGRGIVDTPNDFGQLGSKPTHPELLDWLAIRFRDSDQSLKGLHRMIVTSETYRQVSSATTSLNFNGPVCQETSRSDSASKIDADNQFLWRMHRTRLDAECVRDAMLMTSGQLDLRMGGPSDRQFDLKPGRHVTPIIDYSQFNIDGQSASRRSVYRFLFRTLPDPFMEALDCPAGDQIMPTRANSVTVQQALAMWNDVIVIRHSEHFAKRLTAESPTIIGQIELAFQLALGRAPRPTELNRFVAYAVKHGLANLCRLLYNTNEFIFID